MKSGPIYGFDKVFSTNTNPPNNCAIDRVVVDWDARESDFESTIDESNETNNKIVIDITNFPQQRVWVKENF